MSARRPQIDDDEEVQPSHSTLLPLQCCRSCSDDHVNNRTTNVRHIKSAGDLAALSHGLPDRQRLEQRSLEERDDVTAEHSPAANQTQGTTSPASCLEPTLGAKPPQNAFVVCEENQQHQQPHQLAAVQQLTQATDGLLHLGRKDSQQPLTAVVTPIEMATANAVKMENESTPASAAAGNEPLQRAYAEPACAACHPSCDLTTNNDELEPEAERLSYSSAANQEVQEAYGPAAAEAAPDADVPPDQNAPHIAGAVGREIVLPEVVELRLDANVIAQPAVNGDNNLERRVEIVQELPENPLHEIDEIGIHAHRSIGFFDWQTLVSIWNMVDRRQRTVADSFGIRDRTLNHQEHDEMYRSVDIRR